MLYAEVVTGAITNRSAVRGAINGAAAGAAVTGASRAVGQHPGHRDLPRDAAVGTEASVLTGTITGRRHTVNNALTGNKALTGAAAGAAINLPTR